MSLEASILMRLVLDAQTTPFQLDYTLECGQLFRWEKKGEWWYGIVQDRIVKINQSGNRLNFEGADTFFLKHYFRLDDNLPLILSKINKDAHIGRAIQRFYGLRIVRQEPWECLISYICATYKNIPAIKNMIRNLARKFGKRRTLGNLEFYTFPSPHRLAEATLEELEECGLGYRAKHVLQASKIVASGEFDIESLRRLDYESAKKKLTTLPGVGQKVADCILLFSLDKLEAFPVDRWIKRLTLTYYKDWFKQSALRQVSSENGASKSEYSTINRFGRRYFGDYAGYAQEYLFHYGRMTLCGIASRAQA